MKNKIFILFFVLVFVSCMENPENISSEKTDPETNSPEMNTDPEIIPPEMNTDPEIIPPEMNTDPTDEVNPQENTDNESTDETVTDPPPDEQFSSPNVTISDDLSFTVWVSSSGSEVRFPEDISGDYDFYRYRNEDCDTANIEMCTEGQIDNVNSASNIIQDNALTLTDSAYYKLVEKSSGKVFSASVSEAAEQLERFSPRVRHVMYEINDTLFLTGGWTGDTSNEIWSTKDGVNWTLEKAAAEFPSRNFAQVVKIQDGSLLLIGGWNNGIGFLNDVWKSSDGINWQEVTVQNPFPTRNIYGGSITYYNNNIILSGGHPFGEANAVTSDEVWISSDNGVNWNKVDSANKFSPVYAHKTFAYKGSLFLLGGLSLNIVSEANTSIWRSDDNGINWIKAKDSVIFPNIYYPYLTELNDEVFIVGGFSGIASFNNVWKSSDGENWQVVKENASFVSGRYQKVITYNGKIYLTGGDTGNNTPSSNNVWRSSDGSLWEKGLKFSFAPVESPSN